MAKIASSATLEGVVTALAASIRVLRSQDENPYKISAYFKLLLTLNNLKTDAQYHKFCKSAQPRVAEKMKIFESAENQRKFASAEEALRKKNKKHNDKMAGLISKLQPIAKACGAKILGSAFRNDIRIGDIDILAPHKNKERLLAALEKFQDFEYVRRGERFISCVASNTQIDVQFFTNAREVPCCTLFLVGPKELNILLRTEYKKRGFKLNRYCITDPKGKVIYPKDEQEIFAMIGYRYLELKYR